VDTVNIDPCKCGRPTKYNPEILTKTKEYIENYEAHGDAFPSLIGLSLALDINISTVEEWGKDKTKAKFSSMLGKILSTQQRVAWTKGLNGTYNASLVKLLLTKHGYSDKTDTDVTSGGEQLFPKSIELVSVSAKKDES